MAHQSILQLGRSTKPNNMNFKKPPIILAAKYLLMVTFSFLCSDLMLAQSDYKVDSLLIVLNNSQENINKVETLLALSSEFLQLFKYEESKKYAEEALDLVKIFDNKKQMASSYFMIARSLYGLGKYTEAMDYHQQALTIRKDIGDLSEMADSYFFIGLNNKSQGKYAEALEYLLTSLKIAEQIGKKNEIAKCYNVLGNIYRDQAMYTDALKYNYAALKLHEEDGNKGGIAASYNNIGIILRKQGNYVEAVKNYLASITIWEEIGEKGRLADVYENLGNIYLNQSKYNEALNYYNASLKIDMEMGKNKSVSAGTHLNIGLAYSGLGNYELALDNFNMAKQVYDKISKVKSAVCLIGIGHVYMNQGHYQEAIKNYLAALEISQEANNKHEIASTSNELGKAYMYLNQFSEAKTYLMNGLSFSKEIGAKATIRNSYQLLAQVESETGNYQQALVYHQLYTAYKDSLINEDSERQIAMLKEQFESEKKDKEILLLTNENQQLENEKKIGSLLLKNVQSEKERVKLENEKFHALNLFNQQQLELLSNEKRLQELQSEKNKADFAFQKAESDKKQDQLNLLNKEKDLRALELKKERLTKNYFIAGLGLFMVLSFFIYRNYQSRQEVKLLTLRNKIASDLHDDVGSTLSSISMFSQIAQTQSKEIIPALETIEDSSKKMLDAMADIVWTINPENDQFEKIIMRMRSFAFELLGAKDIDFEFDTDGDVSGLKLPMEARKNLYLIFKEATNNMVKYSQASRAKFSIKGERDRLTMIIKDNGKGFETAKESLGNGLKNMKKRAAEMGAQLLIDSAPGNGTLIKLDLAV